MAKKKVVDGPINYAAIGAEKVIRENLSKLEQMYRAERVVRDSIMSLTFGSHEAIRMGEDWEQARIELSDRLDHAREAYRDATGEEWKSR